MVLLSRPSETGGIKLLLSFLILGLLISISRPEVYSQTVSERASASTVRLVAFFGGGSGFFVAPDKIATNFHVAASVERGPIFAKVVDNETIWAVEGVMAFDVKNDLAILKIAGAGTPLPIGDSDMLQIGFGAVA